jgi:hypothetical protein
VKNRIIEEPFFREHFRADQDAEFILVLCLLSNLVLLIPFEGFEVLHITLLRYASIITVALLYFFLFAPKAKLRLRWVTLAMYVLIEASIFVAYAIGDKM